MIGMLILSIIVLVLIILGSKFLDNIFFPIIDPFGRIKKKKGGEKNNDNK